MTKNLATQLDVTPDEEEDILAFARPTQEELDAYDDYLDDRDWEYCIYGEDED